MTVTVAVKRCKGCLFWQTYGGNTSNAAMRKLTGDHVPENKSHACLLILRDVVHDGKDVQVPIVNPFDVRKSDKPGPRFGERIGPNGTCQHQTPKRSPFRKLPPAPPHIIEHIVEPIGYIPAVHDAMKPVQSAELSTIKVE